MQCPGMARSVGTRICTPIRSDTQRVRGDNVIKEAETLYEIYHAPDQLYGAQLVYSTFYSRLLSL